MKFNLPLVLKKITSRENRTFSILFIFFFFFLAIFKLFLVGKEEIVALEASYDDLWYIRSAAHWLWFNNEYNSMTLIHLPVYAIYIALVHLTGIPLRIGIELTFLVSGFYLVYALRKIGLSQFFSLVAYALIIFNPVSFFIFNRSLSETLYSALLMLSLAGITLMFADIDKKRLLTYSILSGFFMALAWLTREEGVLIAGILVLMALLILLPLFRKKENWKTARRKLKIAILIPIAMIAFFSLAVRTANYFKFGLFATSELNASSYKKAYSALLRIKPEKLIRYVPVTSDARKKAYSVSSSLKELESYLENRSNLAFGATKGVMGINDEMAAGWFYWTLRESVNSAGYKSAKEESDFYERVAHEINKAIDEKKIPGRAVPVSFVDPATFFYLPSQGLESFQKIWKVMINTEEPPDDHANLFSGEAFESLNSMANRRIALIEMKEYNADNTKVSQNSTRAKIKQNINNFAWSVYGNIILYLTYFALLLLAIFITRYKKIDPWKPVYFVLSVLLFASISHIFLFVLLDVNSWPGDNPGYLFPIMPIFSSFLVLFVFQALKEISKRYNQ